MLLLHSACGDIVYCFTGALVVVAAVLRFKRASQLCLTIDALSGQASSSPELKVWYELVSVWYRTRGQEPVTGTDTLRGACPRPREHAPSYGYPR